MAKAAARIEKPEDAARHCVTDVPYRMVVFAHHDQNGTPVYWVAGLADSPSGAAKALRKAHARHGGKCFYCKEPVAEANLTIDHAEAVGAGGRSDLQNLLLACRACNQAKGRTPIELYKPDAGREWLSAVRAQIEDRLNRLPPG